MGAEKGDSGSEAHKTQNMKQFCSCPIIERERERVKFCQLINIDLVDATNNFTLNKIVRSAQM